MDIPDSGRRRSADQSQRQALLVGLVLSLTARWPAGLVAGRSNDQVCLTDRVTELVATRFAPPKIKLDGIRLLNLN